MNYILYGKQYPMIKKRLDKLLKERLGEIDEFNIARYDLDNVDLSEALDDANTLPLGYERKAVIFDNVSFLNKGAKKEVVEQICELVKAPNDAIDLFFINKSDSIDDKSPIVSLIKENGQIFTFVDLKKEDWPVYAKKYFTDRNVTISSDALDELIKRVDGDLNKFINEANKLSLYKNNLNLIDITMMVAKPLEDDAFQMCNALIKGDNASALSIYRDLKLLGSRATDSLIPLLSNQFRFMSMVFYLNKKGLDVNEIMSELGASYYRVKIALDNRRYLNMADISHALDELYYLDLKIKSGQVDRFYGFELFLINFPN